MELTGDIREDLNVVIGETLKGLAEYVQPNGEVHFEIPLGDGKICFTCRQIYTPEDLQRE